MNVGDEVNVAVRVAGTGVGDGVMVGVRVAGTLVGVTRVAVAVGRGEGSGVVPCPFDMGRQAVKRKSPTKISHFMVVNVDPKGFCTAPRNGVEGLNL